MLSCMQDLRHLDLDYALARASGYLSSAAFDAFQKFGLPHLSRLSISAPLSTVIALLSCVNFPLETEVGIKCRHEVSSLSLYLPLDRRRHPIPGLQGPYFLVSGGLQIYGSEITIVNTTGIESACNAIDKEARISCIVLPN
ncbi:hypothetical protein V8E55_001487, partial [Tylopilus felleus]